MRFFELSCNAAIDILDLSRPWQIIRNLGQGSKRTIEFSDTQMVEVVDPDGNILPPLAAKRGEKFHITMGPSGTKLSVLGPASSPEEIEVLNGLASGSITVRILKDGHIAAEKTSVEPDQKAVFELLPRIFVDLRSEYDGGSMVSNNHLEEFNLLGIRSADVVMSGGGSGETAVAFRFSIENTVMV